MEWAVYNGELWPLAAVGLPAGNRSFLYGEGLFETLRVDPRGPVQPGAHLRRLREGARLLGFPELPPSAELLRAMERAVAANGTANGALRLTVALKAPGRGLLPPGEAGLDWLVTVSSLPYREQQYDAGFRAVLLPYPHPAAAFPGLPVHHLKHTSALPLVLGRRYAAAAGADEGLYLNRRGELTEGTVTNLFWIRGGRLYTPPVSAGLLSGVARRTVARLARDLGVRVRTEGAGPGVLTTAEEAFLTNSLLEVMPLVAVDGRPVGSGRPGPLTRELLEHYRAERLRRAGPFAEGRNSS